MKKLNQKGFGAVEIILILVAIAILGFVGYRAYQVYTGDENTDKDGISSYKHEKKEAKEEAEKSDKGYVVIEDWGVKFPAVTSSELKVKSYKTDWGGNKPPAGYSSFSIHGSTLDEYQHCGEGSTFNKSDDTGNLAYIERQSEEIDLKNTASPPEYIKKIGSYYYYLQPWHQYCFGGADLTDSEFKQAVNKHETIMKDLRAALKNLSE